MSRARAGRRGRGFTLIEMMIALAITGVVLGAAYRLLVANQRFYRSQSVINDIQSNVREAVLILGAELRETSAVGGDLQQMTDTAVTINAMRSLGFVCSAPDLVLGRVVVQNNTYFAYRAIDGTRDSVFIFRDGNVQSSADDRWLRADVLTSMTQVCASGAVGTRIAMAGMVGGGYTQMDSVSIGSPVRTFETINYRLYNDGTGTWWLGIRNWVSGAWSQTSPVAGPLRATDGLDFDYLDSTGTVTAVAADVRQIRVTVRGQSTQPINVPGHPSGVYKDSLSVLVALRNN